MRALDEYVNGLIGFKLQEPMSTLARINSILNSMKDSMPEELTKFKDFRDGLEHHKASVNSIEFILGMNELTDIISSELESSKLEELDRIIDRQEDIIAKIEALRDSIIQSNKQHNESLRQNDTQSNIVWDRIQGLKDSMSRYSSRVYDICAEYGILSSDVEVPEELIIPEKLEPLYKSYAEFLEKEINKIPNPITKLREEVPDTRMQGVILLIIFFLSFTPILTVLAILGFVKLIMMQMSNGKDLEYYSLLAALMFNINPSEYKVKTYDDSELLPEDITDEEIDEDERFKDLIEELDRIESEESGVKATSSPIMSELEEKREPILEEFNKTIETFNNKKEEVLNFISEIEELLADKEKEIMESFKGFGEEFSYRLSMNTSFILGEENFEFERVDYGDTNLIIRPSRDAKLMKDYIRVLTMNALMSVKPLMLEINIYDPNGMGQDLMALYDDDFKRAFKVYSDDLGTPMAELTKYAQDNLYELKGLTIREFNTECESTGRNPKYYKLLIVMSQPKTMEEDEALKKFLEYSVKCGVIIWVVSDKLMSSNARVISRPFEMVRTPIRDKATDSFCRTFVKNYKNAIKGLPRDSLDWDSFINNICPKDERWTKKTNAAIELYPGYKNGDPSEATAFTVGHQGNIHALGAGTTGAGKSVFLNQLVGNLTWMYSPKDIELWMIDFKGNEFNYYLGTDEYPQRYPHMRACLCTSDGDYASSLFAAFEKYSMDRYAQMQDTKILYPDEDHPNFKSLKAWNEYWEALSEREEDPEKKEMYYNRRWPRVFMVCDEFAVIFNKASSESIEIVKRAITSIGNVARACGMHVLFTSQNMDGTVSGTTLKQFSLRFGLRMDEATSMDIMGSKCSSSILEQNGYLYVRSTGLKVEEFSKYKTPFIDDGDKPGKPSRLRRHIMEMDALAKEKGIEPYKLIYYLESTKHPIQEMYDLYEDEEIKKHLPDYGMFFLGERMAYEENKLPDNIQISAVNNTNIYAGFENYNDIVLFFNTLMGNIHRNRIPGEIFINTAMADLSFITEAESYISKDNLKKYLSEKVKPSEIFEWINTVYEKRKAKNKKDVPLWIFLLGWNKAQGIGIDPDATLKRDLTNLMQLCGEFNIHIIFISTNTPMGMSSIIEACKYRIAGKVSDDDSRLIIGNKRAGVIYEGMKSGYIFVNNSGVVTRDKLYISEIKHEVKSDKLVLKDS